MDIENDPLQKYNLSDEVDYIDKVDEDFAKNGNTDLPCPRCGGKLILEDHGSAHVIRCEKDNCIRVSYKGL